MQYSVDLFARHGEFFHDFLHGQARFQILEYGGNRHAVILKHPAPLTLPGMLSTAGHWDQSRAGMFLPSFIVACYAGFCHDFGHGSGEVRTPPAER
jgi:hypothetical protein